MIRCLFSSTLLSSSFRCRRRSALFSFIVFASTFLYKLKQRGQINGGNRDLTMSHYHIHKYCQCKSAIVHFIVLQYSGHILIIINWKVFQSNTSHPPADSLHFKVSTFEHVEEGVGPRTVRSKLNNMSEEMGMGLCTQRGYRALYKGEADKTLYRGSQDQDQGPEQGSLALDRGGQYWGPALRDRARALYIAHGHTATTVNITFPQL